MVEKLLCFRKKYRRKGRRFVSVAPMDVSGRSSLDTIGSEFRIFELARRLVVASAVAATLICLVAVSAHAQDSGPASAPNASATVTQAKPAPRNLPSDFGIPRSQEFELALIAGIGILTLLFQGFLLLRTGGTPSDVSRVTLITLIITLATGTLIMGYDSQQLVPIIGLFGSIIGYLLGKSEGAGRPRGGSGVERDE